MSSDGSFRAYYAKTEKLRLQQAGLEIVLRIRSAIEEHARELWRSGTRAHDLELHIGRGGPSVSLRRGHELERLLVNKTLSEQKRTLEKILRPYADSGYIPNFHVSEATFATENVPHAVIKYDFVM